MLEAFGVREAVRRLRLIGERAAHPSLFAKRAYEILLEEDRSIWAEGRGWEHLAASTLHRKLREGQNPRAMEVTGNLRRIMTEADQPGQIFEVSDGELRFGLDPVGDGWYGRFAQLGEGEPKREILAKGTPRLAHRMADAWGAWIMGRE